VWWLILILILAFLIVLTAGMALRAEIDFRYRRRAGKDELEIILRLFKGLGRFRWTFRDIRLKGEKEQALGKSFSPEASGGPVQGAAAKTEESNPQQKSGFLADAFPWLLRTILEWRRMKARFYRSIQCTALEWKVEIGVENPMYTALLAGVIWALLGRAYAALCQKVDVCVERPVLLVCPQFQKIDFSCELHCIFKARMGHIIFMGLKLRRIRISRKRR
jgi:hypothetical protein